MLACYLEQDAYRQVRILCAESDMNIEIELLKFQLADTKAELTDAKEREIRLLSLLENEQEKMRLLMLPPPDEKKKNSSWLGYFRLRR